MGIAELIGIIAGSNVLTAAITAWLQGRTTRRTVKVDEFKAITDEWNELHNALKERVGTLEISLQGEQNAHEETRSLLRVALRHIRDVVAWSVGDRKTAIPEPPKELMEKVI